MAKSTQIEADLLSVITTNAAAPTAAGYVATLALCNAPSGNILDYPGMVAQCYLKAQSLWAHLKTLKAGTDSTDTANLAYINGIIAVLAGTGSPSTQVVTDIGLLVTAGPTAADLVDTTAAAGPIMSWANMAALIQMKIAELKIMATLLYNQTAVSDTANKALLLGVTQVLV